MENFDFVMFFTLITHYGIVMVMGYIAGLVFKKALQKYKRKYTKEPLLRNDILVLKGLFLDDVYFPESMIKNQNIHNDLYVRINNWAKKTADEEGKSDFLINWTIVRNISDFDREMRKGIYDIFSFDYDLQEFDDRTGYDAIKLLVACWNLAGVSSRKALVFHTQNHIGKNKMISYIKTYLKVRSGNITIIS